ncbi:hypothetical protein [Parapusillimonas granuli]|uniref:Uncharacterized protein n=1 Tax=Parapusillimonas granuli TaxID=380911 RepID=A0A853G0R6_9BURK|nr:hypothetical protein [Parapusillimonas granuli]MBB5217643.1 transcriptional regulator with XRE-family HTH domain [Parapusillimonas granuli]NYT51944.1 hypothetical protein [Parapusillimonas granuli]
MKNATHSPVTTDDVAAGAGMRPRLVQWLYRKAELRGHSRHELARQLGITFGELMTFSSGAREMTGLKNPSVRTIAHYLELPPAAVWLLAGKLSATDFLMPDASLAPVEQLIEGVQRIAQDPVVGPLVPPEVFDVPDSVKALLCALYEDATTQELFPPRRLPMLLQGLQDAAIALDEEDAQAKANDIADGRLH